MNLRHTYPPTLLAPDERVGALRLALDCAATEEFFPGGRYHVLGAYATPNAHPGRESVRVTVVLDRSPRDSALLLSPFPSPVGLEIRLNRRVVVRFVDTALQLRQGSFSCGYPALGEELVTNIALTRAFEAFAAARSVTPAALATLVDAAGLYRGLEVRCRSDRSKTWNRMDETVLAGALLGDQDQDYPATEGVPFGDGTLESLADAAIERIRSLDSLGLGYDVRRWLQDRLDRPAFEADLSSEGDGYPPQVLEWRVTALEEIPSLPALDPNLARDAVVVATGGVRPLRPSVRSVVLRAFAKIPVQQVAVEDPEEFFL